MIDLMPACRRTADVLATVTDEQLSAATPCADMRLDQLLAHIGGLALAFTAAARKEFGPLTDTPPQVGAQALDGDWRTSYPARLAALADAYADPSAWQGMTRAGGVDFPGEVGGLIALTEVVVHGWDVARATGQPYDVDAATAAAVLPHVTQSAAEGPVEGLFGPAIPVADDAPVMDRIVGLTGRDPAWRAP
ncbi:TIGR03086 family metal-binding protein [Mycolicibacterium holsaticum]|uniref:TIGR03086 family protein n=1 Tax=Mycolicibacterium holsaticum TaxID=152142 RepID=A0A1E3S2A9_9MYCO|nr:TIGR03086 family metal-binding protein [Mycolicibacterium holsaticum]ODQ96240.1 TIGR03086 family protein [Mycolicibacterium holsaticum]